MYKDEWVLIKCPDCGAVYVGLVGYRHPDCKFTIKKESK